MAQRFVLPFQTTFDRLGVVAPGSQFYFYTSGTSSPLDTYADKALTTPNTNPVVADSAGLLPDIWLQPANYKVVAKTSADVELWTADPVDGANVANNTSIIATGTTTGRILEDRFAEQINPYDDGATGDGTTDDRAALATADTLATTNGSSLRFSEGTFLINSNLTIAADCVFEPGASVKVPTGVTVTFTGALSAGPWQIFELAGTAAIDLSKAAVDAVNPVWFGAKGDVRFFDGNATASDATLTGPAGTFETADVGKEVHVFGAGASVGTITNAEDDGAGEIKITVVGHTIKNGGIFSVKDVVGTTEANATWICKIPLRKIDGAVDNGSGLIRLTITGHPYSTGEKVTVFDVLGTTEANGDSTVTKIDADTIDLQGSTFTNAYVSGGFAKLTDKITLKDSTFTNAYTSGGTLHGTLSTTVASYTSDTSVELADQAQVTTGGVAGRLNVLVGTDSSAAFTAALAAASDDGGSVVAPWPNGGRGWMIGNLQFDGKLNFKLDIGSVVYVRPGGSRLLEINSDTRKPRFCEFRFNEIDGGNWQEDGILIEDLDFSAFNIMRMFECNICMDITTTGTSNTNDVRVEWQLCGNSNIFVRLTPGPNVAPQNLIENWAFRIGLVANCQIGYYKPDTAAGSGKYNTIWGAMGTNKLDNPGGIRNDESNIVDEEAASSAIYLLFWGGNVLTTGLRGRGLRSTITWLGANIAQRWVWGDQTRQQWTAATNARALVGEFRSVATTNPGKMVQDNNGLVFQSTGAVNKARINFGTGFAAFGGSGLVSALSAQNDSAVVVSANRTTDDGIVYEVRQDGVAEGGLQVSGVTVSIAAAVVGHWTHGVGPDTPVGTILSNTDELCDWWIAKWTDRDEDSEGNIVGEHNRREVVSHAGAVSQEMRDQYPAEAEVVKKDNSTLTKCRITTTARDPAVAGVYHFTNDKGDVTVAGGGWYLVRVCSEGGPVALGDLICSSSTPGVGMNQGDDMPRSYTVAKARGTYDPATDGAEKTIPCTLICG